MRLHIKSWEMFLLGITLLLLMAIALAAMTHLDRMLHHYGLIVGLVAGGMAGSGIAFCIFGKMRVNDYSWPPSLYVLGGVLIMFGGIWIFLPLDVESVQHQFAASAALCLVAAITAVNLSLTKKRATSLS